MQACIAADHVVEEDPTGASSDYDSPVGAPDYSDSSMNWAAWEDAELGLQSDWKYDTPINTPTPNETHYRRSREALSASTFDSWDTWDEFDPRGIGAMSTLLA